MGGARLRRAAGRVVTAWLALAASGTSYAQTPVDAAPAPQAVMQSQAAPPAAAFVPGKLFAEPTSATPADPAPPRALPAPGAANQYLFGSGEAAALSRATWAALVDYVTRALAATPRQGVVLAAGSTLQAPRFVPCEGKPPAVVTDIDESAILNVGWQYDDAANGGRRFDGARWRRWEQGGYARVAPTPGAVEAVSRLHALGVEVVFNSNRDAAAADGTVRALATAGLGRVEPGRTLFLREEGAPATKDPHRAAIADRFCVLAMLGDQLGDFSDLFDQGGSPLERRAATTVPAIADLWGEGWFLMPNALYGTALKGGVDEIFPAGLRWTDPGAAAPAAAPAPAPAPAPTTVPTPDKPAPISPTPSTAPMA
jgi:5'-nucleotidase (lipoprotein e(P4) family)